MNLLLSRWFLIACCILCNQMSYAQRDEATRPKLILKTNPAPLLMFFTQRSSAGLAYEVRIGDRWTIGGAANIRFNSPIKYTYPHKGFLLVQDIRQYKLNTRLNWFLGLNTMWANSVDLIPASFNQNGSYYTKSVRHEYNSFGVHVISGFQPQIKSSRFTIDLCGGMGASYVQSHFTNLTGAEMAQITANSDPYYLNMYNELLDRKTGDMFKYSIYFGFHVGYIISR